MKRARDLNAGDEFTHRSGMKIPGKLKVKSVTITPKGRVVVVPKEPWSDYQFTFEGEQRV